MSVALSIQKIKKLLSHGGTIQKKGWFGSKARNHVAFTLHCDECKPTTRRRR